MPVFVRDQSGEPSCEGRQGMEQQNFDAVRRAGEAVFEALAKAMRFHVAKGKLALHATCVQRDDLARV